MNNNLHVSEAELHAYVDGELDVQQRRAVEAWLVSHPKDAERIATWTSQMRAIRDAYSGILAEPVPAEFERSIDGPNRRALRYVAMAASLAAAFALGSMTGLGSMQNTREDPAMLAGLSAHVLYVPEKLHPVEVTADSLPHLQKWLTNRVGLPVEPPDLSASGLALMGGRLVSVGEAPAAMLMYESSMGERYTVLVAKTAGGWDDDQKSAEKSGIRSLGWTQTNYRFVLTGPDASGQLEQIKARISDPV